MKPVRIVLVDDHPLLRKGLRALLQRNNDIEVVGEAGDALEGIRLTRELDPHVLLMDIKMPVINGREAVEVILREKPEMNIIILTAFEDDENLFQTIRLGVKGYLLKNIEPDKLVDAIFRVARGETIISESLTGKIFREIKNIGKRETTEPAEEPLSPREKDILCLLAEGLSNKEMASELSLSENTVKIHVQNILKKLNMKNRVQAAIYAIEKGLSPKPHDPVHP